LSSPEHCHLLSIGVQQVGTNMVDPKGRYQYDVAAACSGIRSLTAICALTAAYAFVFFTKTWKRAIVLCLAVPLAIVSNVLRLFTIVIASEVAANIGRDPEKAGHYVHDSTWISMMPYVIAFVGVLFAGRWLKEDRDVDIMEVGLPVGASLGLFFVLDKIFHVTREHGLPGGPGPWVVAAPAILVIAAMFFSSRHVLKQFTARSATIALVTVIVIASGAGAIAHRRSHQRLTAPGVKLTNDVLQIVSGTNVIGAESNIVFLPPDVGQFKSQPMPLTQIVKEWLPPDTTYGQRRYIAPDKFFVDTMVVLMGSDRTSIHNPRYCLPAQNLEITADERDSIRVEQPVPYELPVSKLRFAMKARTNDGEVREVNGLFVYWFVSDTKVSAEHGKRMLETSRDLLRTGVMERWAYVICMTFFEPGAEREAAAYARLKDFIRESVPQFQTTTGQPVELSQAGK
jgi:exosortase/archaeosortase family protein